MQKLRNIAIIAHVDHGKTTLVDKMIMQSHVLRDNAKNSGELILDNNDLERERGITILSKNVSVIYKDCKINIIDTPGHADFGGEVERVLNMCDGVLLLVDAFEGTMPQTRFVLQKALSLGKKPIVVINKVDKPNCRPEVVNEQVFDLMFSLGATEEQLDYKTIYGSAKQGWMSHVWNQPTDSISPLLDTILDEIPEPAVVEGTPQMLITSLEYSSYIGRIAVGKVTRGELKTGQNVTLAKRDGVTMQKSRIKELMVFEGLGKKKVDAVPCGEICALIGIDGFEIGDTICDESHKFKYADFPVFPPEKFARVQAKDTMKRKQFVKGMEQIAQEGAIQIFRDLGSGMEEVIVGVVGVLQLEVLEYRLKNEYNVDIRMQSLPYEHLRWILNDPDELDIKHLDLTSATRAIEDMKGNPLLLFGSPWSINWAEQHNEALKLSEFGNLTF